jgi:molybdopterin-guanine dinucleotide biosynthesis protein A
MLDGEHIQPPNSPEQPRRTDSRPMTIAEPFDAVVLAGGAARRLGGADKPAVEIDGVTLLDRVLAACEGAESVVVVGPERLTAVPVRWSRESPPGGGPVPALAAGLSAGGSADFLVVLAADLPFLDPAAIRLLISSVAADPAIDAAVYVDAAGKDQLLVSAFRREALTAALAGVGELANVRLAAVFNGLALIRVPDVRGITADCDTWDAITAARRLLAPAGPSDEDGRHGRHS